MSRGWAARPLWGVLGLIAVGFACDRATGARSPAGQTLQAAGSTRVDAGAVALIQADSLAAPRALASVSSGPVFDASLASAPDYEQADLDPTNDAMVAPPEPLAQCAERLKRAGIAFRPASLAFENAVSKRGGRSERVACGAEQVVTYLGGPARVRYNAAPLVTCRLALALARFEQLAMEEARLHLGQRVIAFKHLGTYSCRKMVRFDFVSEHSYANAIDIQEIVLEQGERLSVARHFGALHAPAPSARATFLRSLARRAFDERVFSTVLTPYWDGLHRDHFHLDLARYRVDGTRPADAAE